MKKNIDTDELKEIQKEILIIFSEYCESKDLTYYLTYGTLIGAVRHKGYIPWDDDIDVMMPRADYEMFLATFNKDSNEAGIRAVSYETEPEYYLSFAKLVNTSTVMQEEVNSDYKIGVYIDIFPLDNLSDDYETAKAVIRKAFRYNQIMLLKNLTFSGERAWYKNAILGIGRIISHLWTRDKLIKKMNSFNKHVEDGAFTKYIGTVTGISASDESRVFDSDWFKETTKVEFEGRKYTAPAGYDQFLRKLYGDYMKLPPEEDRLTHHVFKAWYK